MVFFDRLFAHTPTAPIVPFDADAYALPKFSEVASTLVQRLRQTETIEDVLTVYKDITEPVAEIKNLNRFLAFSKPENNKGARATLHENGHIDNCITAQLDYRRSHELLRKLGDDHFAPFDEPMCLTTALLNVNFNGQPWHSSVFGYRSKYIEHGNFVHVDDDAGQPDEIFTFAANERGTLVADPGAAIDVLKKFDGGKYLHLKRNGPGAKEAFKAYGNIFNLNRQPDVMAVRKEISECLILRQPGFLHVMPPCLPHMQDGPVGKFRNFFGSIASPNPQLH